MYTSSSKKGTQGGAIAGAVIGTAALFGLVLCLCVRCRSRINARCYEASALSHASYFGPHACLPLRNYDVELLSRSLFAN